MKKLIISSCIIVLSFFAIYYIMHIPKNFSNVIEKVEFEKAWYPKSSKYDLYETNTRQLEYKDFYMYINDEKMTKVYSNRNYGEMPAITFVGTEKERYIFVKIYSNGYVSIDSYKIINPKRIKTQQYKLSNSKLYDSLYDFLCNKEF